MQMVVKELWERMALHLINGNVDWHETAILEVSELGYEIDSDHIQLAEREVDECFQILWT